MGESMRRGSRNQSIAVGIDVGSTTVKAVVVDPVTKEILWSDYQRHQTKQPENVLELLERDRGGVPGLAARRDAHVHHRLGRGAALRAALGAKFVQEVNAVTLAVENLHPDVGSVIELGGQDAKIIMFKKDEKTGDKTAIASMNDKCASGTGATIDKCFLKVGLAAEEVVQDPLRRLASCTTWRPSAASSPRPTSSTWSRAASRRTRSSARWPTPSSCRTSRCSRAANTLQATRCCSLGGPNTYLPFLQDCWRMRIPADLGRARLRLSRRTSRSKS